MPLCAKRNANNEPYRRFEGWFSSPILLYPAFTFLFFFFTNGSCMDLTDPKREHPQLSKKKKDVCISKREFFQINIQASLVGYIRKDHVTATRAASEPRPALAPQHVRPAGDAPPTPRTWSRRRRVRPGPREETGATETDDRRNVASSTRCLEQPDLPGTVEHIEENWTHF